MIFVFQEPSLFAIAKLLETGLVNLFRLEVLWKPVTAHLLEVSVQIQTSKYITEYTAIGSHSSRPFQTYHCHCNIQKQNCSVYKVTYFEEMLSRFSG